MSGSLCLLCNAAAHGERCLVRSAINSSFLTKPGGDTTRSGRVSNASLQPASQDSEDADTVATADCSRWRPVSAPQPWWAMEPCESGRRSSTDGGRRVRARTAPRLNDDASSSSQLPGGSPGGRPTAAERAEALSVIRQMKEAEPPILSRRGAPPKPNVVACAIALYRGEVFESDADALRIFGAAETTMVRRDWVEDKLARFAPAGFNTPGEPLPSYLLDRPKGSTTGFDPELPSYVHLEALRARFGPSQAALDGSEEAAEADECWLTGHLREMARRERMHATARSPIIPAATRPSTRIVLCGTNM